MKQSKITGNVREIFASIQGEGLFVGTMQLFIRLGQNDENDSFLCRTLPGDRNLSCRNPVTPEKLVELVTSVYPLDHFFCVSFIGSDALAQADFLAELLPMLRTARTRIFAETSGTPIAEFSRLEPLVDNWCIDLKCTGLHNGRAQKNLEKIIEQSNPDNLYFRLAMNADEDPEKLIHILDSLKTEDYTLVIQPCAVFPSHISDWDTGTIIEWIKMFRPCFAQVRWIPQVHKLLRIL